MRIPLVEETFENYFSYSLKTSDEVIHGIKFNESSSVESIIQISELNFTNIIVINKNEIEDRTTSKKERIFLSNYCLKKGLKEISFPDGFENINDFFGIIKLAADLGDFISIEEGGEGDLSIIEVVRQEKELGQEIFVAREIFAFGEIEEDWNVIDPDADFCTVAFFDPYAKNLQEYVTGKPAKKIRVK